MTRGGWTITGEPSGSLPPFGPREQRVLAVRASAGNSEDGTCAEWRTVPAPESR